MKKVYLCRFSFVAKILLFEAIGSASSYDNSSTSQKRKRPGGGDSDSDDEMGGRPSTSAKDVYKRRMNQRGE